MQTVLIVVAVIAFVLLAALAGGAARAARRGAALRARLEAAPAPRDVSAGLPDKVRAFAIRGDARPEDLARLVRFGQEVEMQLKPDARWQPMRAVQWVATGAPGFVWQAEQDFGPLPKFRVTDAFTDRAGALDVQLMGAIPAVRASGDDLARGEAMRYLAELPWVPDAILGNPDLAWRMHDAEWAEVSLEVAGQPVRVRFRFDAGGDIVEMYGPGRATQGPGGETVLRDWQGFFRNYRMIGPRRIPAEGEVGYLTRDGYRRYFQGRIVSYEALH